MNRLHEKFDEIVADVPVYGDLDRAIEQAERDRHRRYGVVAGLAAAAAVVAVIVGVLTVTRDGTNSPQPIGPSTPTETTTPANTMVNGRIQTIEEYLARERLACESCRGLMEFQQHTGTALVGWNNTKTGDQGIRVIGPKRQLADISVDDPYVGEGCSNDRPCTGLAALGPGADEVTVQALPYGSTVLVLGFDNTVRRTIDLSAAVDGEQVRGLAWSPDRSRLAVTTRRFPKTPSGTAIVTHVWLVDSDGGEPQLVHTASNADSVPEGNAPAAYIWDVEWSPDGTRLGFIEDHGYINRSSGGQDLSSQAVSLLLPAPGQEGPGAATTLYRVAEPPVEPRVFLWSPDGTRVAVRDPAHVLELSADDGSVLAQRTHIEGFLIWPARRP